jgi:hypothetical protein
MKRVFGIKEGGLYIYSGDESRSGEATWDQEKTR